MKTCILVILDGLGINPKKDHNAVAAANAPTLKKLLSESPHTELDASEGSVGLPKSFMGNSEVGHLNIGAGRVVYQDFSLISNAIEQRLFFQNPAFLELFERVKAGSGTLHLMGLVSDGGVHSHNSHLTALLEMAKEQGVPQVFIHAFTDGRDTSPTSGVGYLEDLEKVINRLGIGKIATVTGRFFAMDRDKRWERTETAYRAIVQAKGDATFTDPAAYAKKNYEKGITDEFLPPGVSHDYRGLSKGDGIIYFNFRADRARQLSRALTQPIFNEFDRMNLPPLAGFVSMTPYDETFTFPTAYQKPKVPKTIGELVSSAGEKQLRIAETEKYAHVTYFFNGGEEKPFAGEKRILIPSPREVKTYDLKPEMSAVQVTDALLKELDADRYAFVVVNFANPDMVGHTGNLAAATRAVEVVDGCLARLVDWVRRHDAFLVLTADHGNCEMMQDENGTPLTAHTLLPVPFVIFDPARPTLKLSRRGKLCDIAPTILKLWNEEAPREMTGKSLID